MSSPVTLRARPFGRFSVRDAASRRSPPRKRWSFRATRGASQQRQARHRRAVRRRLDARTPSPDRPGPEEGRELSGAMTVSENLDIGGHRLNDNVRAERREWLFDLFPVLKERRCQTAATLSGGEQQMLTIARPDDEARPLDAHRSRM